jgi:hypothetical protein
LFLLKNQNPNLEICNGIQEFQEVKIQKSSPDGLYKILNKNGIFYTSEKLIVSDNLYDLLVECNYKSKINKLIRYQIHGWIHKIKLYISLFALFIGIVLFWNDFHLTSEGFDLN